MFRETKPKTPNPKVSIKLFFGLIEGSGDGILGIAAFLVVIFAILALRTYGLV